MTPEILAILNQAPLLAFVFIAVYLWNKANRERDKDWQDFIDKQGQECREWSDKSTAALQAWQLEMAQTIDKIAGRIESVDTKLEMIIRSQTGTGPLPQDKRRPL